MILSIRSQKIYLSSERPERLCKHSRLWLSPDISFSQVLLFMTGTCTCTTQGARELNQHPSDLLDAPFLSHSRLGGLTDSKMPQTLVSSSSLYHQFSVAGW